MTHPPTVKTEPMPRRAAPPPITKRAKTGSLCIATTARSRLAIRVSRWRSWSSRVRCRSVSARLSANMTASTSSSPSSTTQAVPTFVPNPSGTPTEANAGPRPLDESSRGRFVVEDDAAGSRDRRAWANHVVSGSREYVALIATDHAPPPPPPSAFVPPPRFFGGARSRASCGGSRRLAARHFRPRTLLCVRENVEVPGPAVTAV